MRKSTAKNKVKDPATMTVQHWIDVLRKKPISYVHENEHLKLLKEDAYRWTDSGFGESIDVSKDRELKRLGKRFTAQMSYGDGRATGELENIRDRIAYLYYKEAKKCLKHQDSGYFSISWVGCVISLLSKSSGYSPTECKELAIDLLLKHVGNEQITEAFENFREEPGYGE